MLTINMEHLYIQYIFYELNFSLFFVLKKKRFLLLLAILNKIVKYTDSCHIQQFFDPHITIQYCN